MSTHARDEGRRRARELAPGPQVLPLIRLRWSMVRSASARRALVVAAFVPLLLCIAAVLVGRALPRTDDVTGLLIVLPSLLLAFLAISIVAPLAAGGGTLLYPADQLVAFPVRHRTTAYAALALAPLNLAWLVQVVVSLGLVSYVSPSGGAPAVAAAATIVSYVLLVTALGQCIGWIVIGVRQSDAGRIATWGVLAVAAAGFLVLLRTGRLAGVIDSSPAVWVLSAALRPGVGDYGTWAWRTGLLLAAAAVLAWATGPACSWALRRPDLTRGRSVLRWSPDARRSVGWDDLVGLDEGQLRRRIDRAGILRAPAPRRGVLVLATLPTAVLLLGGSDVALLVLLPGLVAAASGLLVGINAFCLDAGGATWLGSLPGSAQRWFSTRTRVVAELALLCLAAPLAVGLIVVRAPLDAALVLSCLGAAAAATMRVVALAMRSSVTRPHRALLLGPRDAPAPPGAMAVQSLRLSASVTGTGLLFTLTAIIGAWWGPVLALLAVALLSARSLLRTSRLWADPQVRSRVIGVVGSG